MPPKPPKRGSGRPRKTDGAQMTQGERQSLRMAAEYFYVNDVLGHITLVGMSKLPQFAHIKLRTLEQWCTDGRWIAQRKANQDRIRQALEQRLGDQLVEQTAQQLEQMKKLYDRAMGLAMSADGPEPRTWEGVTNLTLKLGKHMNELRQNIITRLTPEAAPNPDEQLTQRKQVGLPKEALPQLSPEESRLVAHELMRMRQLPAATATPPTEDREDDDDDDDAEAEAVDGG